MSDAPGGSRVGSQFGPYRLRRVLGQGGMGEVYEAEDTVKDRIVALKLLPPALSQDPEFRKRMQREAHSAGRLHDPHVVPIHDYGEIDGQLYVDMRMIEGTDLHGMLKRFGPLPPARAVAIIRQIASALDAAHAAGVMHRDVKPANILISRDDFACLVDFGIASAASDERLTQLGTAVGTYAYMAPERFSNADVTYRADVYALACVLHECLTGSRPYAGDSVSVLITSHLMEPIPRPSAQRHGIPKGFDQVVARGMAKKPEDRYASAGDLAVAAHEALTSTEQDDAERILQRSEATTHGFAAHPPQVPPTQRGPSTPPPYQHIPTPPTSGPPTPPPPAATPGGPYQPPWGGPPSGPQLAGAAPARKTNVWIPIAAVGGVVVLVLAGLGIWLGTRDDSPPVADGGESSTTSRTTTTRTTTTTTANDYEAKLRTLVPTGYASNACQAVIPPAPDALATMDCGQSSVPGGPKTARYSVFPDLATLNGQFSGTIKEDNPLFACPSNSAPSPTTWHTNATPDKAEGQIACGLYNNGPDLVWTKESGLFLGAVQGAKIEDLYKWWSENA